MTETPYNTYNVDRWGNAVPSPNGYLPVRAVTGFDDPQDLFYDEPRGEIYIASGGIISVLNGNCEVLRRLEFTLDGTIYTLQKPTGIYVSPGGTIYICDFDGGAVIKADLDGVIEEIFYEPKSELIARTGNYRPNKIVVDSYGRMYVQVFGVFEGIYCLSKDGAFINFFGANRVQMTFRRYAIQMWNRLKTKEQRRNSQNFVPIEYSNLFIDDANFIYASVTTTTDVMLSSGIRDIAQDIYRANASELVRKLNPLGVNVLPKTEMNWFQDAAFSSLTVDRDGVMTMVDTVLGVIYQCDKNGKLMFAFGGLGGQLGLFQRPVSVIGVGDALWVLDNSKRNITIFELTEFGREVHYAMKLYNEGKYNENIGHWENVIRTDINYLLAYVGLGKAYYQIEDYKQSMYYFKLAGDRQGYSDAFSEQSLIYMRSHFKWFVLAVLFLAAFFIARKALPRRFTKKDGGKLRKDGLLAISMDEMRYCFYSIRKPVYAFDSIKWAGKGSVNAGFVIIGMFFLVSVLTAQLTGFVFNHQNPDKFSMLSVLAVTVGGFGVVFAAHYAVSSVLPSEATVRQAFITMAYSLLPYILCQAVYIIASNFISLEMGVFLNLIRIIGIGWSGLILILGMYQTHRLSFGLIVANLALTALGTVIIVFFMVLLYSLFQQLYMFFYTIFSEIMFRF
jgi:tetratricopeptide (TPR) repeat protein